MPQQNHSKTIPPEHRCLECFRGPDEAEFPLESTGQWKKICTLCAAKLAATKAVVASDAKKKEMVGNLIRATVRQSRLPQWQGIAAKLLVKFGGSKGLVDTLHLHITDILRDPKSSATAKIRALKFLTEVLQAGMEEQHMDLEVSSLTDEQLEKALETYVDKRLQLPQEPETDAEGNQADEYPYE